MQPFIGTHPTLEPAISACEEDFPIQEQEEEGQETNVFILS